MIPFEDKIVGLSIGAAICIIFSLVVYLLIKKDQAKNEVRVQTLTEEQKQILINAPVTRFSTYGEGVIVKGLLYEIIPKNQEAKLVILFYNTYHPNSLYKFESSYIKVTTQELNEHNLKQGDYVDIKLEPTGGKLIYN